MKRILIVDDDTAVTNYLMVFLMQTGVFEPVVVNDSREVEGLLSGGRFDLVLLDLDMPAVSGMDILHAMRDRGDETPVIILTGVHDVELAVKSMKLGAFDYLTKPVDEDKLLQVMDDAMEHGDLHREIDRIPPTGLTRQDLHDASAFDHFPTQDPALIRVFHQAERFASSDLSIFIWGESGTGKEGIARAVHKASPRRDRPFVAVEVDSKPPDQFPAFFFGQERDWSGSMEEAAGVLEQADKGTLFLNNIDALTLPMQVRLTRFIQTGEYYRANSTKIRRIDVRMIVASARDLASPEYTETFSRDLLYHLMVNLIKIPPLRERPGDIPLLAGHFLSEEAERSGKKIKGFSEEFLDLLSHYSFPNNMQELSAIIAHAVANEESDLITTDSLSSYIRERISPRAKKGAKPFVPRRLDEVLREHVALTLRHFGDDRGLAAEQLGVTLEELERYS
ncbi:MAG: sigma-54 dependent transcriptional regulator [Candidatus Krumholzibacteria bacterium]|nr:sigma-54 dependent transcriptional regulator [Candidatus Krumholzibacteria bacterium]